MEMLPPRLILMIAGLVIAFLIFKKAFEDVKTWINEKMRTEWTRKKPPSLIEEPEKEIKREDNKLVLRIKVPGVKFEKDIDLKRLKETVEIRAYGKEKMFFTFFKVPPNARIISKSLENGELIVELET